jgi:hypothetical protein
MISIFYHSWFFQNIIILRTITHNLKFRSKEKIYILESASNY